MENGNNNEQNQNSENTNMPLSENKNPSLLNKNFNQNIKTKTPQNQNPNINSEDLKKAIIFLLGKELKDYSLEKKKEYLSKKISIETLEKAMELYPIIEANTNSKIEDYIKEYEKKNTKTSFFDGLFDVGVLTTVIISTLGINYLLDLQRNKKNELFYRESEKKLNEELIKISENMKKELANELNSFCKKTEVDEKIKEKITLQNQNAGLNLNLGSKNVKENINSLKTELSVQEHKLKEMSVKLENSGVILKQDVLRELGNIIEENNKNLLLKIIEMQNKLIINNTNLNANNTKNSKSYDNSNENKTMNEGTLQQENMINFIKDSQQSKLINKSTTDLNKLNDRKNNPVITNEIINTPEKISNNIDQNMNNPQKIKDLENYFKSEFNNKEENNTSISQIITINDTQKDDIKIKDTYNSNPVMVKRTNIEDNFRLNSNLNNEENITTSSLVFDNISNNINVNAIIVHDKIQNTKDELDFPTSFNNILNSLDKDKQNNFILQIKVILIIYLYFLINEFSYLTILQNQNNLNAIYEANKNDESGHVNINRINLSNGVFKTIQANLMKDLLESSGFSKESQYKYIFIKEKLENLEKAVEYIENYRP